VELVITDQVMPQMTGAETQRWGGVAKIVEHRDCVREN
jgi:hypothetical protein